MNDQRLWAGAAALIIGLGLGYWGHGALAGSPAKNAAGGAFARGGGAGGSFASRGGMGGGLLTGTVTQVSDSSLTLDTRDGSSHVVLLSSSTQVSKSVSGSLSDIAQGAAVIVSGTEQSDGSVSASLIQLRPAMPAATVGQ